MMCILYLSTYATSAYFYTFLPLRPGYTVYEEGVDMNTIGNCMEMNHTPNDYRKRISERVGLEGKEKE